MSVEEIPSDQVIEMTDLLHRAFNAGGCDPICHCCVKELKVGLPFKLATVTTYSTESANSGINLMSPSLQVSREVMLCDTCTVEMMAKRNRKRRREYEKYRAAGGGCYRVNGKIVH